MTEEPHRFLYKRDKPMPMKLMAALAALFSLGGLAYSPVFSIVMGIAAAGLFVYQNGIELNFNNRSYRLISALGPQAFGTWQPLPNIKCVSVFKTELVSTTYGRSNASITTNHTVIQVNLATEQNQRIRLFETENTQEAFVFAERVAKKLNLNIWDATEREGKWLDRTDDPSTHDKPTTP